MPRPAAEQSEPVNGDSFLDIVASVVSIMIIMVVMEGMRIKNTPVKVSVPASPQAAELEKELANERSMRSDVLKAAGEIRALQQQTVARGVERDLLATVVAAAEDTIQQRRRQLSGAKQIDFDLARNISQARSELEGLVRQRQQAESVQAAPVVVESYPTPISHAVDGPEAHLLINNGRVMFVPVDRLLEEFRSQAKREAYKLADRSEISDKVGPIGGFTLHYTLERYDVSSESGRGGAYARLQRWTLEPTDRDLGEPVRLALEQGSDFRQGLSKILPGRTAITIWVYPDGFEAFRQIRKELYRLNYSVAARPLPPGAPISGSPEGSKSAAQ